MAFIDLTNVEILEEVSEDAKVLVEENGEIKRTAMPSGGGENWDAIFEAYDGNHGITGIDKENIRLVYGDLNKVVEKVQNGELPKIKIKNYFLYGEETIVSEIVINRITYIPSELELVMDGLQMSYGALHSIYLSCYTDGIICDHGIISMSMKM